MKIAFAGQIPVLYLLRRDINLEFWMVMSGDLWIEGGGQ
jgi:hypothetical protein